MTYKAATKFFSELDIDPFQALDCGRRLECCAGELEGVRTSYAYLSPHA